MTLQFINNTIVILSIILLLATVVLMFRHRGGDRTNPRRNTRYGGASFAEVGGALGGVRPRRDFEMELEGKKLVAEAAYSYPLVGAYYRWRDGLLKPEDLGPFVGVAVAQSGNPHDPYAVAVYRIREDGTQIHLGFVPRGHEDLHHALVGTAGQLPP